MSLKNLEVYENIEDAEERMRLGKIYNDNQYVGLNDNFIDDKIQQMEEEITKLKEAKIVSEKARGLGWSFFDISDDICDYGENYIPFVGTIDELKQIIPNPECYK